MKKSSITSREFQHGFGQIAKRLKAGERVKVTRRGETLGFFTKAGQGGRAPNYLTNLDKLGGSAAAGQKLIDEICGLS